MKKDNNNLLRFLAGVALVVVGMGLLLMNIEVRSFSFYRISGVDTALVLLVILALCVIWGVLRDSRLPWILVVVTLVLIVLSVMMGTRFVFKRMNAITLIAIVAMIAVGIGLIIAGALGINRRK